MSSISVDWMEDYMNKLVANNKYVDRSIIKTMIKQWEKEQHNEQDGRTAEAGEQRS